MKKIAISLVVVVVVVGIWLTTRKANEVAGPVSTPTPTSSVSPTLSPSPTPSQQSNTVIYTDSGYSPATITIKKGQTVIWKNNSSKQMRTASAIHPTHSVYPTTGGCVGSTFDACMGLPSGQEWSFGFENAGTWKYHNHMNPSHTGTVVVE
ncbi:MAG: cupredoxin domain-containing protein [Candidatus Yanofskybacteria bacterium]|nr:cupredoxin domain-containing protein [Candidatus Yanofskybacteria bacterium]